MRATSMSVTTRPSSGSVTRYMDQTRAPVLARPSAAQHVLQQLSLSASPLASSGNSSNSKRISLSNSKSFSARKRSVSNSAVSSVVYSTTESTPFTRAFATGDNHEGHINYETMEVISWVDDMDELLKHIRSHDVATQLNALVLVRKELALECEELSQDLVEANVIPKLVDVLKAHKDDKCMMEACWSLAFLSRGFEDDQEKIIRSGAIAQLLTCVTRAGDHPESAAFAMETFRNLAEDNYVNRDFLLSQGVMRSIVEHIKPDYPQNVLSEAAAAIYHLCRSKPLPRWDQINVCLPFLAMLLSSSYESVLTNTAWTIAEMTAIHPDIDVPAHFPKLTALINAGIVSKLAATINFPSNKVKVPALRALVNVVSGEETHIQSAIDGGALQPLLAAIEDRSQTGDVRVAACWAVSNIAAGNSKQVQALIDAGVVKGLLALINNPERLVSETDKQRVAAEAEDDSKVVEEDDEEEEEDEADMYAERVLKQAAFAVNNITSAATDKQMDHLVRLDLLPTMCALLSRDKKTREEVVIDTLDGLHNVLKVGKQDAKDRGRMHSDYNEYAQAMKACGGYDTLLGMIHDKNRDVAERAIKLLENFFDAEFD